MKLRRFFITGLAIFVPLVATVYILWIAFNFFDSILKPLLRVFTDREIPGLSLAVTAILIISIGAFATIAVGRKAVGIFERGINRIPLVGTIYSTIKGASSAFFMKGDKDFRSVVLVEYPKKNIFSIGFTTSATINKIQDKTKEEVINVFIPSTPNPTTGFLVMVPKKDIKPLDLSIEEAFRVILSGGFTKQERK